MKLTRFFLILASPLTEKSPDKDNKLNHNIMNDGERMHTRLEDNRWKLEQVRIASSSETKESMAHFAKKTSPWKIKGCRRVLIDFSGHGSVNEDGDKLFLVCSDDKEVDAYDEIIKVIESESNKCPKYLKTGYGAEDTCQCTNLFIFDCCCFNSNRANGNRVVPCYTNGHGVIMYGCGNGSYSLGGSDRGEMSALHASLLKNMKPGQSISELFSESQKNPHKKLYQTFHMSGNSAKVANITLYESLVFENQMRRFELMKKEELNLEKLLEQKFFFDHSTDYYKSVLVPAVERYAASFPSFANNPKYIPSPELIEATKLAYRAWFSSLRAGGCGTNSRESFLDAWRSCKSQVNKASLKCYDRSPAPLGFGVNMSAPYLLRSEHVSSVFASE